MYYTHLAFGFLVSLIALNFINIENTILFILTTIFFSIFPDIDETRSKIGRKYNLISKIINFFFGHRGFIHTIYIPLILFFSFSFINYDVSIAILIGYFSHLFLDAITKAGIRPLYPIINKRINGPFKTNSIIEKIIFISIISVNLYLILISI